MKVDIRSPSHPAISRSIGAVSIAARGVLIISGLCLLTFVIRDQYLAHWRHFINIHEMPVEIKTITRSVDYVAKVYSMNSPTFLPRHPFTFVKIGRPIAAPSIDELLQRTIDKGYPRFPGLESHRITYIHITTKNVFANGELAISARLRQLRGRYEMWFWPSKLSQERHKVQTRWPYQGQLPPDVSVSMAGTLKYPNGKVLRTRDLTRWKLGVRFDDDEGLKREAIRRYLKKHPEERMKAEG